MSWLSIITWFLVLAAPAGEFPCSTRIDELTKKLVYTSADSEPENEGGPEAFMKAVNRKLKMDSIPDDWDTRFVVAFIVDTNGNISGERVIRDKTNSAGKRLIEIAKTFKWSPAVCNGKKVDFLRELRLQVCLQEL